MTDLRRAVAHDEDYREMSNAKRLAEIRERHTEADDEDVYIHWSESDVENFAIHAHRDRAFLLGCIDKLEKRLEVYDSSGKHRLPESADGIACRDETIKQQDQRIDKLQARLNALEAEANMLRRQAPKSYGYEITHPELKEKGDD